MKVTKDACRDCAALVGQVEAHREQLRLTNGGNDGTRAHRRLVLEDFRTASTIQLPAWVPLLTTNVGVAVVPVVVVYVTLVVVLVDRDADAKEPCFMNVATSVEDGHVADGRER